MEEALDRFLEQMKVEKDPSENTLQSYERDLRSYIKYLQKELQHSRWKAVSHQDIERYIQYLNAEGKSPATRARHLSSLRTFHQFLLRSQETKHDPSYAIKSPKIKRDTVKGLSQEEVDQLLQAPDLASPAGLRDWAMLEVLYATGLKVSELVQLNIEDFHLTMGVLRCKGTSGRERMVPLGKKATEAVESYLKKSRSHFIKDEDERACFLNIRGQRLTRQGCWKLLKDYGALVGLKTTFSPETLRQTFAVHLLSRGADLQSVQELMGHTTLSATQAYSSQTKSRLKAIYSQYHPRA